MDSMSEPDLWQIVQGLALQFAEFNRFLERIADALDRLAPAFTPLIRPDKPAGEDALTRVTNAMRVKWDDEDRPQPRP